MIERIFELIQSLDFRQIKIKTNYRYRKHIINAYNNQRKMF